MKKSSQNRSHLYQYQKPKSLQEDLKRLLESGEGADVRFETSNLSVQMRVHSDVVTVRCLALRSTVLEFLLERQTGKRPEGDELQIRVRPVSRRALEHVVRYIYTGIIEMEDSKLYEICVLSEQLGVPSLVQHVFRYLNDTAHPSLVLYILDRAVSDADPYRALIGRLSDCLSGNCSQIMKAVDFRNVSLLAMQHIVKQESLGASESEVWEGLVKWACCKSGICKKLRVSSMTSGERRRVAEHLSPFCRPGLLRILNLETNFFASEVEPLDLFSPSELLLKYRFDATVGEFPFETTFQNDRYSFLARVRQRCMSFESERHPHPRGPYPKQKVEMPQWVSELEVTFDERTALGRYADLKFFLDEDCAVQVFSLRASQNDATCHRSQYLTPSAVRHQAPVVPKPVQITGNRFWFTFYAPKNIGDLAWGFKFLVSVVR